MEEWLYLEPLRVCMEDYLRQRGISTKKAFRCLNPAHEDKHPSMSYNTRVKNVHCFSCGINYDLFDMIGLDYGITDFAGQYEKACDLFHFEKAKPANNISANIKTNILTNVNTNIKANTRENGVVIDKTLELLELEKDRDATINYFLSRGINAESCKKYRLFQKENRAYLPIFEREKCTGWAARGIDDSIQPRYKNSKGAIGIWNSDRLLQAGAGETLYVTEGIFDAIILEQIDKKAISICGSQNTRKLIRFCAENISTASSWKIICCGDADDAGRKMNTELRQNLEKLGFACGELILPQDFGDINDIFLEKPNKLRDLIDGVSDNATIDNEAENYAMTSAAASLESFFAERDRRAGKSAISTGFDGLDKLLDGGLFAGLYILGAISSLGKTSFMLQIADYIAENECDVLFFSLEQSRFELMAKSLSRTTATLDGGNKRNAFTARQLLSGTAPLNFEKDKLLREAKDVYAKAATGMFIREGMADIGVADIRAAVREHVTMRKTKPVVIVDYLQILTPADNRATDKQNTDRTVVELKRISRDFDIPVFAISSFNRENYKAAVSMEAFKESGAVEYSADVLFGLQLKGAGEAGFDVNAAKAKEPRQIEMVMLKNRNGIPFAKLPISYDARFSLFEETPQTQGIQHMARKSVRA